MWERSLQGKDYVDLCLVLENCEWYKLFKLVLISNCHLNIFLCLVNIFKWDINLFYYNIWEHDLTVIKLINLIPIDFILWVEYQDTIGAVLDYLKADHYPLNICGVLCSIDYFL